MADVGRSGSNPAGVDEAKLSTTAGVMAQALLGSDVRTDKVAALQQSIATGTYNVSAPAVADKLMRALLE
jgi:negative regulator of flagellin synthesis FlgM